MATNARVNVVSVKAEKRAIMWQVSALMDVKMAGTEKNVKTVSDALSLAFCVIHDQIQASKKLQLGFNSKKEKYSYSNRF